MEYAKCRRERDLSCTRASLCGDRACRVREMQRTGRCVPCARVCGELEDESWRLASTTVVRGVAGELEAGNWRLCVKLQYAEYLGSWKMRIGDLRVQLYYAEYLGSWKIRIGDFVVEL